MNKKDEDVIVKKGGKRFVFILNFKTEKDATKFKFEKTPFYSYISKASIGYSNVFTSAEQLHSFSYDSNVLIQLTFDNATIYRNCLRCLEDELSTALNQTTPIFGDIELKSIGYKITGSDDQKQFFVSTATKEYTSKANLRDNIYAILKNLFEKTYSDAIIDIFTENKNDTHIFVTNKNSIDPAWELTGLSDEVIRRSQLSGLNQGFYQDQLEKLPVKSFATVFTINKRLLNSDDIDEVDKWLNLIKGGASSDYYIKKKELVSLSVKEDANFVSIEKVWKKAAQRMKYLEDLARAGNKIVSNSHEFLFGTSGYDELKITNEQAAVTEPEAIQMWNLFKQVNQKFTTGDAKILSNQLLTTGIFSSYTSAAHEYVYEKAVAEAKAQGTARSYITIKKDVGTSNFIYNAAGITDTTASLGYIPEASIAKDIIFDGNLTITYYSVAQLDSM